MQVFKSSKNTLFPHQKYQRKRKTESQNKGSIFNLPKQVFTQRSAISVNPQSSVRQIFPKQKNKFISEYQTNLKKIVKKNSSYLPNKIPVEKPGHFFFPQPNYSTSKEKMRRNKSFEKQSQSNKNLKTLNLLYRTIISTEVKKKPKLKLYLKAKKLAILQKNSIQPFSPNYRLNFDRNSSFEKYKFDPQTIQYDYFRNQLSKYNAEQGFGHNQAPQFFGENERLHLKARRGRFQRQFREQETKNQIKPWNQYQYQHQCIYNCERE